jgi:hypothetical protein
MKKQTKKLTLSKDTIKRLESAEAGMVRGGIEYLLTAANCYTNFDCPNTE